MPDKTFNKVVWDGQTLIDLTSDTVTASSLQSGVTAHDRSGVQIVGTGAIGNYVSKNGDSMSGPLSMLGVDINLTTTDSTSNDSGDIAWWYGNGQEKARIWTDNLPTTNTGLNYRAYDSDGHLLVSTKIMTADTTQPLTFNGVTNAIKYTSPYATIDMIKFKSGSDSYGSGLILGGGGLTVIGGGESADVIASTRSGGTEELHLASDGAVALWTNVQNGEASAKKFLFNSSGDLEAPRYLKGTYVNCSCADESNQLAITSKIIFANADNYFRKASWSTIVSQLKGAFVSLRSGTTLVSSDARVIIDEGSYMVIGRSPGSGETAQGICVLTMRLHASADTSTRIYFCNQMPTPIAPVGIIPTSYTTGKTANAAWYYIGTNGQGISNTGTIYKNEGHCISVAYVTALI